MSYCEDCGCRLRDSGRCGWCQEEAVIYYEQYEYRDENMVFSDDFMSKVNQQEDRFTENVRRKKNQNDEFYQREEEDDLGRDL